MTSLLPAVSDASGLLEVETDGVPPALSVSAGVTFAWQQYDGEAGAFASRVSKDICCPYQVVYS